MQELWLHVAADAADCERIVQLDVAYNFATGRFASAEFVFDRFKLLAANGHAVHQPQTLGEVIVFGYPRTKFRGATVVRVQGVPAFA